ncbi:PorP/SprF family type IX secretion system membrane protein [Flavobacterium branchiicola]|uniref:Type IX secretion system membrane protein PorP/SprF n=1 Tax=Flavobacterium branchiicola TaxID=1114875 RepID=A0ABV9PLB1_9FLAO|nr:type IX secretion system membrane protein PorP/SprF [Flavobacterium branchiicola]MBS7256770.1 type IX secretion system membrane protein PorP/SprF [Flavobacterium branchiicola]
MCLKFKFTILLLLVFSTTFSQEGIPVYSDYLSDNYYLIHPSMAGASNCSKLRFTARYQWLNQDEAPLLQTLSFNGRVAERSGAGVILFNDKNGFHSQKGIKITFAHHILFSRDEIDLNQLSFGINAGIIQNQLDQTSFKDFDPVIIGTIEKGSYFNIDFGASYNYQNFYLHATVQGALESRRKIYSEYESKNLRKYLLSFGYVFGNKEKLIWEPSILYQAFDETKEKQLDINLKVYKNILKFGSLWTALSYRRSFDKAQYGNTPSDQYAQRLQYVTPIAGINYKNFVFAYTYSHVIGNKKFEATPYHQVTLGINLFCKKERYDCECPALNF